jgi:hypothetical protein
MGLIVLCVGLLGIATAAGQTVGQARGVAWDTAKVIESRAVPCSPGAVEEPEPCGASTDAGCGADPAAFAPMACGQTIRGTVWATTSDHDTDWYQLVTTESMIFTWTVTGEFPVLIMLMQGPDCNSPPLLAYASAAAEEEAVILSDLLPAGTYWFWISTAVWEDLPCEQQYIATLACMPLTGACCEPAAPWCELLTSAECTAAGGFWLGMGTVCDPTDCNDNGIPDRCELALYLAQDCNFNGIPDDCDIAVEFGGPCVQGPDHPGACSTDWNQNGWPDECEEFCDLNGDIIVDVDDYWVLVGAFGTCYDQPQFVPVADIDGDGCITLADYRIWRICYQWANGFEFVIPQAAPAANVAPAAAPARRAW